MADARACDRQAPPVQRLTVAHKPTTQARDQEPSDLR